MLNWLRRFVRRLQRRWIADAAERDKHEGHRPRAAGEASAAGTPKSEARRTRHSTPTSR